MGPVLATGAGVVGLAVVTPLLAVLALAGAGATVPRSPAGTAFGSASGRTVVADAGSAPRPPADAIRTAMAMVGTTGWYRLCDRLVCRAYGYANSGHPTAVAHWTALVRDGHARPADRCPPPGAFAFWGTGLGQPGHVAIVVVNVGCTPDRISVVSNDVLDQATGARWGVYHVTLARLEAGFVDPARYLGWALPFCSVQALPSEEPD